MLTATSCKLLSQCLRVFVTRGEEGNVAITFALALVPMVYGIGAAVDYSRANSVNAGDSTALMLSKNAASLTSSAPQTEASNYFNALFQRPDATGVTVTATYTSSGGSQVVLNATANVRTDFMGLMGLSNININIELSDGEAAAGCEPAEGVGEPNGQAREIVECEQVAVIGGNRQLTFFARERPHGGGVGIDQRLEQL
jgi:hypothetical protein